MFFSATDNSGLRLGRLVLRSTCLCVDAMSNIGIYMCAYTKELVLCEHSMSTLYTVLRIYYDGDASC